MSIMRETLWPRRSLRKPVDVVGLGEVSVDHLCVVDAWPVPGEKRELLRSETRAGGQVASALLGCVRLGLRAAYLGSVGTDPGAEVALRPLIRAGLDVEGVRKRSGARTRSATILVRGSDGERTILADRDPRLQISPAELEVREIEQGRLLHLDASDPDAALWAARQARQADVPITLDVDSTGFEPERLLAETDFPVVSRSFAESWGGTGDLQDGLRRLAGAGARLAVVTCGAEGAWARHADQVVHVPAFAIEPADTTGAGDAFHAGFIWAVLQGETGEGALRSAHAVAALACAELGAQAGLPRLAELEHFLGQPPPLRGS